MLQYAHSCNILRMRVLSTRCKLFHCWFVRIIGNIEHAITFRWFFRLKVVSITSDGKGNCYTLLLTFTCLPFWALLLVMSMQPFDFPRLFHTAYTNNVVCVAVASSRTALGEAKEILYIPTSGFKRHYVQFWSVRFLSAFSLTIRFSI